jgi:hypothetical protein
MYQIPPFGRSAAIKPTLVVDVERVRPFSSPRPTSVAASGLLEAHVAEDARRSTSVPLND